MTKPKQSPTKTRESALVYMLPYLGGGAMYTFRRWRGDPRDVDEMRIQEADDRYHALKDDGRLDR